MCVHSLMSVKYSSKCGSDMPIYAFVHLCLKPVQFYADDSYLVPLETQWSPVGCWELQHEPCWMGVWLVRVRKAIAVMASP